MRPKFDYIQTLMPEVALSARHDQDFVRLDRGAGISFDRLFRLALAWQLRACSGTP
jgi:hypothetical protein